MRGWGYTVTNCEDCGRRELCAFGDLCADCRAAHGLPRSLGGDSWLALGAVAISMWFAIWVFIFLGRS